MEYAQILVPVFSFMLISFFSFICCYYFFHKIGGSSILPLNWPIFGMIPSLVKNLHRIADWIAEILQQSQGTLMIKGPWFSKMELLLTADPANVQYVLCKHHNDFHKGVNFNQIFDILGDGIFNSDFDKWKYQRKIALAAFSSTRFRSLMAESIKDKLGRGLIPVLERSWNEGLVVDLQDIFQSFSSDVTYMVLLGHDPMELSLELDEDPPRRFSFSKGIHEGEEAVLRRHILPDSVWKLERWLRIGKERKLSEAVEAVDGFIYEFLMKKREQVMEGMKESSRTGVRDQLGADLVSLYIEENHGTQDHGFKSPDIFLRDTFLSFLLAGQDTVSASLTWFFWLLITHPRVEAKIIDELKHHNFCEGCDVFQLGDSNKMVYLHSAIYEALRLYPPVPFNHRAPKKPETLPSGHQVKPWTMIILCAYAMGRMKWIWGEDCEEFRPERWITEQGTVKHEPSHKFFAFNTGPRICLGKEIAMVQMKAVVCTVLRHKFRFELAEGHQVEPASSVLLGMKHGLKVKVKKN